MHHVYFITEDRKGDTPVKIGYSSDPDRRIAELQTGNPNRLKLIMSMPLETEGLARSLETIMHRLAAKRGKSLCGEWFMIYGGWDKFIGESLRIFDHRKSKEDSD